MNFNGGDVRCVCSVYDVCLSSYCDVLILLYAYHPEFPANLIMYIAIAHEITDDTGRKPYVFIRFFTALF